MRLRAMVSQASTHDDGPPAGPTRAVRRKLPFGRSALLRVDGSDHVVALVDVSISGAYVATRVPVPPGATLVLKLWLPSAGGELAVEGRLARVIPHASGGPAGIALRFLNVTPEATRRLEQFVHACGHQRPRLPARHRR